MSSTTTLRRALLGSLSILLLLPAATATAQEGASARITSVTAADGQARYAVAEYREAAVQGKRVWVNNRVDDTVEATPAVEAMQPFTVGGLTADAQSLIGDRREMFELNSLGGSSFTDLEARYGSYTAGLLNVQAQTSGNQLDGFLRSNQAEISKKLPELGRLQATDVKGLNQQLSLKGLTFSSGQDAHTLARRIDAMPSSPDKVVTQAGANWAQQAQSLRMPALKAPASGGAPRVSEEALMFGLFANKSLTALSTDRPDLFAQVQSSGLSNPAAQEAWRRSMLSAHQTTAQPLSSSLSDPCSASFLTAMSTGSSSAARQVGGRDCGSCVATGLAASSYMTRLFDRSGNTTFFDPSDNRIYPQEWTNTKPWAQSLLDPNGTASRPNPTSRSNALNCSAPSATTDAARTVLPGVFSQLSQGR